ncbi:MAG: DUF3883 domain-containing protein [Burkholderiaceae bacterium]|nr:DUF3883 domain-containing protein [Burkholderiaceae bacterium]
MSTHWSNEEVEAIVADHLQMLTLELAGQSYSKAEHRRRLQGKLNQRPEASIEFKHCNISAVLIQLGFPYIRGYKPRSNYQAMLVDVVTGQLQQRSLLDQAALAAVQQPAVTPLGADFAHTVTQAPVRQLKVAEVQPEWQWNKPGIKRDYLEREAQNQSLGLAGEEFVLQFEHWRLNAIGQCALADRVEHVAQSKGDGLGYDVLSFEPDGRERFIEVKTTAFGKDTPFFVSKNELSFSRTAAQQFHLYRLFEFRKQPRLFDLAGEISNHCLLDPVSYRASFS